MYNTSDVKRELSKTQKECLALATDSNASIVSIMLNAGGDLHYTGSVHRNDFPGGCFVANGRTKAKMLKYLREHVKAFEGSK